MAATVNAQIPRQPPSPGPGPVDSSSLARPGFLGTIRLIAGLEFDRAFHRRRLLLLNLLIPLAITVPIALAGAPPHHAAAVYAVQFILFGTFGAAIPALRDAETGILSRLRATSLGSAPLLLARAAAGAALDLLELLPSLVIILAASRATLEAWVALPLVLLASLFIANSTGLWIAAVARSVAEGALFAAVSALLLLHASGVFRTPSPGSAGSVIERLAPYTVLHETILATGVHSPLPAPLPLAVVAAATVLITAITAPFAFRSLADAGMR